MLRALPGVSEAKAAAIAGTFRSPHALFAALSDPALGAARDARAALLERAIGGARCERALARTVCDVFAGVDPTARVGGAGGGGTTAA